MIASKGHEAQGCEQRASSDHDASRCMNGDVLTRQNAEAGQTEEAARQQT